MSSTNCVCAVRMSVSPFKTARTGPPGAKKPRSRTPRSSLMLAASSGQRRSSSACAPVCGAESAGLCGCEGGGASPANGSSASSGNGGRSSSSDSGCGSAFAAARAGAKSPEARRDSSLETLAPSEERSSFNAGSHSCIRHSSAATRASAFFPTAPFAACTRDKSRSSSAGVKHFSSSTACASSAMPESIEMPLLGAAFKTRRSRHSADSSSNSAPRSFPSA